MCLVIDTNTFALVFNENAKGHKNFTPVLTWITEGSGRMIYGGTKYDIELARATWMLGIIVELSRNRRAIHIPNAAVDPIARALKIKFPGTSV
jgi:hypothetical protein